MDVEQLPVQIREFAGYLNALLARLDQDGGWCGVFWQRDPDGMRACLDGREVPPWDVVEALLHDLAAAYGPPSAAHEAERARALHGASIAAYDARPGGRDALVDRLDVMLREQRYAAERQAELVRRLESAATREDAESLHLDLAWARDDHERATARCVELRRRMAALDHRALRPPERGAPPLMAPGPAWRPGADERPGDTAGPGTAARPGARPAAGSAAPHAPLEQQGPFEQRAPLEQQGPFEQRAPLEEQGPFEQRAPLEEQGPFEQHAPLGQQAHLQRHAPVVPPPDAAHDTPAALHTRATAQEPLAADPASPGPAPSDPAPAPPVKQRSRRRPRGSARFAGMMDVQEAPAGAVPASAPAPGREGPRGARFAGAGHTGPEAVREERAEESLDQAGRRIIAETVAALIRLRAEGRSGEAHALLAEAAHWPAARYPPLAAELHRAGLGADWATLLWEAVALPADRLVAAADALTAAGRTADGEQILRQGAVRPASEIGEAVLGLNADGRHREVRALLDAYVRMRPPEEAVRSVEADPGLLLPLLLEAARGVSDERHWDLVHALRVAGFTV
ncbi:hypothetical protein ABZ876_29815 [Streptomyces sp. NPDC046931]|uniref:hypothetical protein n=1 Tax=Streptomyces sp. NPDC046931 TaxID=3154806 RepID=UPI0033CFBDDF